jgi:hypothetical protein
MPEPFLSKLREIIAGSSTVDVHVNRMRGIHPCNLCGEDTVIVKGGSKGVYLGASEVWIPADGTYYASPSMVLHYIEKHDYCPPRQYIDAVTAFDMTKAFSGQRAYDELVMSRTSSSGHAERR